MSKAGNDRNWEADMVLSFVRDLGTDGVAAVPPGRTTGVLSLLEGRVTPRPRAGIGEGNDQVLLSVLNI